MNQETNDPITIDENVRELSIIIARLESNNDATAIRYEPNWRWLTGDLVAQCVKNHKCSIETAKMLLSCSYGKFQIMGSVLYELGYNGKFSPTFLNEPILQEIYFDKYLQRRKARIPVKSLLHEDGRRFFATKYNGTGAVAEYARRIYEVMKRMGYEVR